MLSARIAMLNGAPVIIVFNYLILDIGWEAKKTMCVYFGSLTGVWTERPGPSHGEQPPPPVTGVLQSQD